MFQGPCVCQFADILASALIQLGKPSNALGILQESLEITKGTETSIDALVLRAKAYVDLGRHLEAIDDLDQVLKINPGDVRAHATRALAYTNLGQDAKAREDAGRAGELGADRAALDRARLRQSHRRDQEETIVKPVFGDPNEQVE